MEDADFLKAMRVEIDYTNWQGKRSKRVIRPLGIAFAKNDRHPELQWLLAAFDIEKGGPRSFAMKDVHSWKAVLP